MPISDIPPVHIVDTQKYQQMKHFVGRQKAVDFIHKHGGLLVEDAICKNCYWVVRITDTKP